MSLTAWVRRARTPEPVPVRREIAVFEPADLFDIEIKDNPETNPVLCCTGDPAGAAAFNALWLKRIATRAVRRGRERARPGRHARRRRRP